MGISNIHNHHHHPVERSSSNNNKKKNQIICMNGMISLGTSFESKQWLSLDPCGLMGVTVSWTIHWYAVIVLGWKLIFHSLWTIGLYFIIYIPIMILALISLFMAMTTNPGAVPLGARPLTTVRPAAARNAGVSSTTSSSITDPLSSATITTTASATTSGVEEFTNNSTTNHTVSTLPAQISSGTSTTSASSSTTNTNTTPTVRALRRCHKCNDNYKPNRAHHDSVTGRCIVKFDHFCPWVNNAIGIMNHKYFCLFLFYTAMNCFLSLTFMILHFLHCNNGSSSSSYNTDSNIKSFQEPILSTAQQITTSSSSSSTINSIKYDMNASSSSHSGNNGHYRFLDTSSSSSSPSLDMFVSPTTISSLYQCSNIYSSDDYNGGSMPLILILLCVSILFLLFTITMGYEQIHTIQTGYGKIARMKMSIGQSGTEYQRVTEEFNEMFGGTTPQIAWHWFIPISIHYPRGMKKVVLGYEWDESFELIPYDIESTNQNNNKSGGDTGLPLLLSSSLNNGNSKDREMDQMENGKLLFTSSSSSPISLLRSTSSTTTPLVSNDTFATSTLVPILKTPPSSSSSQSPLTHQLDLHSTFSIGPVTTTTTGVDHSVRTTTTTTTSTTDNLSRGGAPRIRKTNSRNSEDTLPKIV